YGGSGWAGVTATARAGGYGGSGWAGVTATARAGGYGRGAPIATTWAAGIILIVALCSGAGALAAGGETGAVGWSERESALASSSTVWNRCGGDFSRQRRMIASSSGVRSGRWGRSGGTGSATIFASVPAELAAAKGARPVRSL